MSRLQARGKVTGFLRLAALPGLLVTLCAACPVHAVELLGYAMLPADTLVPGPASGQQLNPAEKADNFHGPPWPQGQPVQGISALVQEPAGSWIALVDNGFGRRENSADFLLALYRIRPEFRTAQGGSGVVQVESRIQLRDPQRFLPLPRVADERDYPALAIAVPDAVRSGVWLSGADLDPESLQRTADGHFWIGEEFGPWLLHFGPTGRLQTAPFAVDGLLGPDAVSAAAPAGTRSQLSGGFEAMAHNSDSSRLLLMLEKPIGPGADLPVYRFDLQSSRFLDTASEPAWHYPLDEGAVAVGDFQWLGEERYIVLERDDGQGKSARVKRIYQVDASRQDLSGRVRKQLLADLLEIGDPHNLSGAAPNGRYAFAFWTIESLLIVGENRLVVANDNNFPFGNGPDGGGAEDTHFLLLQVSGMDAIPAAVSPDY